MYYFRLTNRLYAMGGFNRKNNKKNPNIYLNSREFGNCSLFVKEFKIGLFPLLKYSRDGKLHARLVKLFMTIKSLDRHSEPGNLSVSQGLKTQKGRLLLREFVFTPKVGIRQQVGNPVINEEDFSVLWEDFAPSPTLFPKGATHYELLYLVLGYDGARNLFSTYKSLPIRKSKSDPGGLMELRLDKPLVREEAMQYIMVMGIRFIEVLGEEEYELFGQGALGIEVLGVC